jgi:hypothetical protein
MLIRIWNTEKRKLVTDEPFFLSEQRWGNKEMRQCGAPYIVRSTIYCIRISSVLYLYYAYICRVLV